MSATIQLRRDIAANWTSANPTLAAGEIGFETDTGKIKLGDGSTVWTSLVYRDFSASLAQTTIDFNSTTDPAAPSAGHLLMYAKSIAGRIMPKVVGPSGVDYPLQPAIFSNGIAIASPGSSTALSYFGMGAFTAVGTVSHPVIASATLREQTRRANVNSAATANSASELRYAISQCLRGGSSNIGGFFSVFRWAIPSGVSGQRQAVGLFNTTSAIATTQDPAALTNCIFAGNAAADTNLQLMYNDGSGTCTKIDLGANFALAASTNSVYELVLFCKPNDTVVDYRVTRLDTGNTVSGQLSTDLPASSTLLCPHFYINNNAVASAVQIDVIRYYLETDF